MIRIFFKFVDFLTKQNIFIKWNVKNWKTVIKQINNKWLSYMNQLQFKIKKLATSLEKIKIENNLFR